MKAAARFIFSLILCVIFLPHLVSASDAPLKVVMDDNYPPYTFRTSDGALQGILVDLWNTWSEKTGRPVVITGMDWSEAQVRMLEGEFDVIDTMFENEARRRLYDFSPAYDTLEVNIFYSKSITGITNIESLRGYAVAVKAGDNAVDVLHQAGISNMVLHNSYESIIQSAALGNTQVMVIDRSPALYFMNKYSLTDRFRISPSLYSGQFHRAVRKGDTKTLELVNSGYNLISEASVAAIKDKWIGQIRTPASFPQWFTAVLASVFIIMLGLLLWYSVFRRAVGIQLKSLSQQNQSLKEKEHYFSHILQSLPDAFFIFSQGHVITDYHPSPYAGVSMSEDPVGKSIFEGFSPDDASRLHAAMATVRDQKLPVSVMMTGLPNEPVTEMRLCPTRNNDILGVFRDVSLLRQSDYRLKELRTKDPLTGVSHRSVLEAELLRMQFSSGQLPSLWLCDIDGLRYINEAAGFSAGDTCLVSLAELLMNTIRPQDIVCRMDNGTFAVLIRDHHGDTIASLNHAADIFVSGFSDAGPVTEISLTRVFADARDSQTPFGVYLAAESRMLDIKRTKPLSHRYQGN